MKVCLLNDSFPPVIDGVVNVMLNYAKYLTEDYNAQVEKQLRYNGFMKGCKSYCNNGAPNSSNRVQSLYFRRIITRQYLEPGKTYYLRMKSVIDSPTRCLHLDYFEICPKEIYDNPEKSEDIW